MPCQPNQATRRPYTKLLSTLRKPDLVWLCAEFDLPIIGSVLNLRDRAKHHLTQNAEVLYRNPRFKSLYPRIHRINHPPLPPSRSSTLCSHNQSVRSPSPVSSFESWHGIEEPDRQSTPQADDQQQPFYSPGHQLLQLTNIIHLCLNFTNLTYLQIPYLPQPSQSP